MGLARHVEEVRRSIRTRGLLATVRVASGTVWCSVLDRFDEWRYRTNTSQGVPLASLEIQSENKAHATPYSSPSQYRIMKKAFRMLKQLRGRGFSESTLVDFGSGTGRVLLVGSEVGFRRVIGVEFSPELCREAEANLRAHMTRRKTRFEYHVVNADATAYDIPADADVFYFFRAFDEHVLDEVARNLVRSRERHPRDIWAIHVKAVDAEVFTRRGFRVMRELKWCGFPTNIYAL